MNQSPTLRERAGDLCPGCQTTEYPNRPKVQDRQGNWHWRCYNPDCAVGYWCPGTRFVEAKLTDEDGPDPYMVAYSEWLSHGHFEGDAEREGARFVQDPNGPPMPDPADFPERPSRELPARILARVLTIDDFI